jgi:hypothetical protein
MSFSLNPYKPRVYITTLEVCGELKAIGFDIDIGEIKKINTSKVQLLEVEKNLWNLYCSFLANRRSREMTKGIGDAE